MTHARLASALAFLVLLPGAADAATATRRAQPSRLASLDFGRRLDINELNLFVTNVGSFGGDLTSAAPGLYFPTGSANTVMYTAGPWIGAHVNGETRVTVAEYSSEYMPGGITGGLPQPSGALEHRVYKVSAWHGSPLDTAHVDRDPAILAANPTLDPLVHDSWSDYLLGAAPHGAPVKIHRLPDMSTPAPDDSVDVPGPDVSGDLMTWCVFNDAEASFHTNEAGGTAPLGVEVQMTAFGFNEAEPLGSTVFLRYRIVNKGTNTLEDVHLGLWNDADVGGSFDDLAGCMVARGVGYTYNGSTTDPIYGSQGPAVGFDVLRGPIAGGVPLGMTAFTRYINGTDPFTAEQSYAYLQGLNPDGTPIVNPLTGLPTRYHVSGDPVFGTGWVDVHPADRRTTVASGPFTMAPGDTQEVVYALIVGQGTDRLTSVSRLECYDDYVQSLFDAGFARPFPPGPTDCRQIVNCPRPSGFWEGECAAGGLHLTSDELLAVANAVSDRSGFFEWPDGSELASFCATISPPEPVTAKSAAQREVAVLYANLAADQLGLVKNDGYPILLSPVTPIQCDGFDAQDVAGLAVPAVTDPALLAAVYRNDNPLHRRALDGVDFGLPFFGGGAGFAWDLFGSSLDPTADPDSFVTVEIRFDAGVTQKAHRYLRLEQLDGSAPPQGRGYLYGGFFDVPFTVWDVVHGVQLDVAFVERTLTLPDGTLSPDTSSIATFDHTWGPDDSEVGGREYLFVSSRPYAGSPRDELRVDGALPNGTLPMLYGLASRLRTPGDVIDDGDRFEFVWGLPANRSADGRLFTLDALPLDPSVEAAYDTVLQCVSAINRGEGMQVCDSPTATQLALVSVVAAPGEVRLSWSGPPGAQAVVERSVSGTGWDAVATIDADGRGALAWIDRAVEAGGRYGYRLRVGTRTYAEAWVDVPRVARLDLLGVRPNPTDRAFTIAFQLPARAPATLELLDVAGRRVLAKEVGALGAGTHEWTVDERLAPGVYVVRLAQGARSASTKVVRMR